MNRPFIVTVASEKGGVGKTTIATNLAVYLKALREDLPVTIASFDNHFSVDQMFAIRSTSAGSVADLLAERFEPEWVAQGEYGVQFLKSERRLEASGESEDVLAHRLWNLPLKGLLILDTRPILDCFTRGALLAADVALTPVKDRASLVNVAAIRALLEKRGEAHRLWVVPSLVDARARLNTETRVSDLLVFAARERDYQVVATHISKSPKVESLASGFSSRVYPVLIRARQTVVHRQFRSLADFVLAQMGKRNCPSNGRFCHQTEKVGSLRRVLLDCPYCMRDSLQVPGHFFFDLRSRRCGFLHPECLHDFAENLGLGELKLGSDAALGFRLEGAGMLDADADAVCCEIDAAGGVGLSEPLDIRQAKFRSFLEAMIGRRMEDWHQEAILLDLGESRIEDFSETSVRTAWRQRRKTLFRTLRHV